MVNTKITNLARLLEEATKKPINEDALTRIGSQCVADLATSIHEIAMSSQRIAAALERQNQIAETVYGSPKK